MALECDTVRLPVTQLSASHLIDVSLKRRARLLINNSSIPRQTRSLIRYALETKDPYLAQVVRRVEGGELIIECLYLENEDEGMKGEGGRGDGETGRRRDRLRASLILNL